MSGNKNLTTCNMKNIVVEVDLPKLQFDVDSVSNRALTKVVQETVSISGQSGSDGQHGTHGIRGSRGTNSGGSGTNGTDGDNGSSGHHGTNSRHAIIDVYKSAENLIIDLKIFSTFNDAPNVFERFYRGQIQQLENVVKRFELGKSQGILLIRADGGDGGDGGNGGKGGNGGDGRDGTTGSAGTPGCSASEEGAHGGNGGDGDRGGDGGRGGNGGNGGNGGAGGNAGDGGHVQVRSLDPRLLMLIEIDCRAGRPGSGGIRGSGGDPGRGGSGGSGGIGGIGGFGGVGGSSGSSGSDGPSGSDGSNGSPGRNGCTGSDGKSATNGFIQYVVVDEKDNILDIGYDKYHASIMSYTIEDENKDEVYEPESDFFITNVKWANNGAMHLPNGSVLSFPSTTHITCDMNDISILPDAAINQVSTDSHRFRCHIKPPPPISINHPYVESVNITSQICLLNRSFAGSQVTAKLTCQYPIQIKTVTIPTHLAPDEQAIVEVVFANISSRSYGECSESAGQIEFQFLIHPLMKLLSSNDRDSYQIISNGSGHYLIKDKVVKKSTRSVSFKLVLDKNAIHQLYDSLYWRVDLLLRNKLTERREGGIRVVPTFVPNIHTDVLLVTNSQVNRAEYLSYQNLFRLFNYTSQTWDIERYGYFYQPSLQWLNTTDLIIFAYTDPESKFNKIKSELLLQHLKSSENAGFISIGNSELNELDFIVFDYTNLYFINKKEKMESENANHLWSGFGFSQPSSQELIQKGNQICLKYEQLTNHQFLYQAVLNKNIHNVPKRFMRVNYAYKYIYRSILNSQIGNRLIMIKSDNPVLSNFDLPFPLQNQSNINEQMRTECIIEREIDLTSNFGRLLCAILFYRGFEKSCQLIEENCELVHCLFKNSSNIFTFNEILVGLPMSTIECEYDRGTLEFPLSKRLFTEISSVVHKTRNRENNLLINRKHWFYLLIQSLDEYIDSQFRISFPLCGCTIKAKQRNRLMEMLTDLKSLEWNPITKDKDIYDQVRLLRLQKLANLIFPISDKRENCVRLLEEVNTLSNEQKLSKQYVSLEELSVSNLVQRF